MTEHQGKFKCQFCNYIGKRKEYLHNHLESCGESVTKHKCDHCDFRISNWNMLVQHVKTIHKTGLVFTCEFCSYTTSYRFMITNHIKKCSPDIQFFNCDKCDFKVNSAYQLSMHVNKAHKNGKLKMEDEVGRKCIVKLEDITSTFIPFWFEIHIKTSKWTFSILKLSAEMLA